MDKSDDWGERRLAAREAERRRRERLVVWAIAGFGIGLPFLAGVVDGITGRTGGTPAWIGPALIVVWAVVGGYVLWRGWRDADEVQRRLLLETAAAAGAAGFVAFPLFVIVGPSVGVDDPGEAAWAISAAAALLVHVWRRGWRA